jgi:glycosyltransferase involved in cell wall biosynthesis
MLRLTGAAPRPIATIHNFYEGGWRRMLAYRLTDGLSLRTTAVSHAAAERFVKLNAVPQRKISVVFNGIETAEFSPSSERRVLTRGQMRIGEQFVWLSVGRIVPAKDYPNLLAAFARVRAVEPDAELWIAGEAEAAEAAHMQALTADQAWGGSIRWLGLRRDLPALLDAADGFVLGSAWEGMPLAAGEAMSMAKPVVATDAGGTSELLGDAGTLVPARNAPALAAAMLALMRTPAADREAIGRAARERIYASFSMDAKTDEWESLYRAALNR